MGVYQNFPYVDWSKLNIDWVLEICERAEKTIANLNVQIENVVRPMLIEQQQYIQSYYNQLKQYMDQSVNKMVAENKKLQNNVNRQLYANSQEMGQLRSFVTISNRETVSKLELEISKLRADTINLISKYNTIWNAMSKQQQATVNKMLTDFAIQYNAQLADNAAKMESLKLFVEQQIAQMQQELDTAKAQLQRDLYTTQQSLLASMADCIDVLTEEGKQIIDTVNKQAADVNLFYTKVEQLFENTVVLLNNKIDTKADIVYVDSEIAKIRELIIHVNGEITVINPVTEQSDSLQDTLYSLYNVNNYWNLSAEEYDELEIRAAEYDQISQEFMSARDYDNAGKWYLKVFGFLYNKLLSYVDNSVNKLYNWTKETTDNIIAVGDARYKEFQECCREVKFQINNLLYMDSPFTGERLPLKNVILQLTQHVNTGAIRADVYDSIGLEAQIYDGYNLTSYDYDWNAANLIT